MKKVFIILLAVMLCFAAAACSAQPAQTPEPTKPPVQNEEPSASAETVVLTFYGFSEWVDSEPYKAYYEAAVAKFAEENPGFSIELQSDPWGDWATKYVAMFAAGNPTDIYYVGNDMLAEFANGGSMLDMGPYVDAGYFDGFFPGVTSMYTWQGAHVAIPFTTDCRMMWYNKDIFSEAGLDPEAAPKTWDELVAMANQIKDNTGKTGFGMDLGLEEFPQQALFCASKGNVISVAADGSITPTVDTPEFRAYLQTLVDMKNSYQDDFPIQNHHAVAELFAAGEFGIIIGNTLEATDIRDKSWYGQALVPSIDGKTNGSFGGGFGIGVSAKSKYPEQAVKFAQILCSAEFCANLISDVPVSEAGMAMCDKISDPTYAVYFDQIQYARQGQPKTLFYMQIDNAVYETVCEVLIDNKSIDDAIADLASKINDIVK